jgi:hypothetical protein
VELEKEWFRYLIPGTVKCVVFTPISNVLLDKLHEIYGVPRNEPSFATYLQKILDSATHSLLTFKNRKVLKKDCRELKKGDALGWIRDISIDDDRDAIIVIENVTRIPEGDSALYDPKQYVENILVRSWKNDDVYIDDYHIDRRNLTVILTCPPEDEGQLRAICSMCSYAWVGDVEKRIEEKLAQL